MERTGRELLPCSRFTRDEDRGLGFGKTAELFSYLNEWLRVAYQLVQHLRPSPAQYYIVGPNGLAVFRHGVLRADTRRTSDRSSLPEERTFSPNPVRAATYFPAPPRGVLPRNGHVSQARWNVSLVQDRDDDVPVRRAAREVL